MHSMSVIFLFVKCQPMKGESRYSVHANGETVNTDDINEAYEIAYGMADAFGHSFIFDNLNNKKVDEYYK